MLHFSVFNRCVAINMSDKSAGTCFRVGLSVRVIVLRPPESCHATSACKY